MKLLFFLILCLCPSKVWAAEVTANVVLKRGTILTGHNVSIELGHGDDMDAVRNTYIGQQLTRTVYTGHKVEVHYLNAPVLVKRNAQVNMIYTFGAMQLSTKGRALQAGAKGETITVMNVTSRQKVMAIILDIDFVEVGQ